MVAHEFLRGHGSLSLLGCYTPGSGIPGTAFDFLKKKKTRIFSKEAAPDGGSVMQRLTAKWLHRVHAHQQRTRVLIAPHPSGTCYDLFKEISSLLLLLLFF